MLYSHTCEYALRALVHLAERPDELVLSEQIARAEAIPLPFLKKIVQALVRAGFLRSVRGPHGGVRLARPPEEITLFQVRGAVDGNQDLERCVFGLGRCDEGQRCPHHDAWQALRRRIEDYLQGTTLEDLTCALEDKRGKRSPRKDAPLQGETGGST